MSIGRSPWSIPTQRRQHLPQIRRRAGNHVVMSRPCAAHCVVNSSPDETRERPGSPGEGGEMGFFGGLGKRLKDGRIAEGLAAAQATLNGDYAAALRVQSEGREQREQARREEQLNTDLANDMTIPENLRRIFRYKPALYAQYSLQRALAGLDAQDRGPTALEAIAQSTADGDHALAPPLSEDIEGYAGPFASLREMGSFPRAPTRWWIPNIVQTLQSR